MSSLPKPGCPICGKESGLLACSACRVIHYCGTEHQIEHRPTHKQACVNIKRAKALVNSEEARLRQTELRCGASLSLYTYEFAQEFSAARAVLFDSLTDIDTIASMQAQLDNLLRVFLLGPHYLLFARYYLPSLMILLRKDQQCYDFIVWFRKVIDIPAHQWAIETSRGITVENADIFEPLRSSAGGRSELDIKIHQVMLKALLCRDLDALDGLSAVAGTKLPREVIAKIQSYLIESPIIAARPGLLKEEGGKLIYAGLALQLIPTIALVHAENPHYWPALFSPDALNTANQPLKISSFINATRDSSSREMADILVKITINAWLSIPGAIDLIRERWTALKGRGLGSLPPGSRQTM